MGKFGKYVLGAVVAACGVVLAGFAMKWGRENDIPVLKDAHDGYDS